MRSVRTKVPATAGYIGNLIVHGDEVFAIGGTYGVRTLLRSTNGGGTWRTLKTPQTSGLRDLVVVDKTTWIVGESGMVARSSDRGATWRRTRIDFDQCLYAIALDGERRLWITGDDGMVWRSDVGHARFAEVPLAPAQRVLRVFIDPRDGRPWLLGGSGTVWRWDGAALRVVKVPTKVSLNGMTCTAEGTLLIAASNGIILRSADGGERWTKVATRTTADLEGVAVTSHGIIAVGDRATALVSHDDGATFGALDAELSGHLWCVAAVGRSVLIGADDADGRGRGEIVQLG